MSIIGIFAGEASDREKGGEAPPWNLVWKPGAIYVHTSINIHRIRFLDDSLKETVTREYIIPSPGETSVPGA